MGRKRQDDGVTERHRQVARDYFKGGKSLELAMKDAGFAGAYGRRGPAGVAERSKPFRIAFNEELNAAMVIAQGADLDPAKLGQLAKWRLTMNLVRGKDEATHSAKLVGSLKDVDLFVRMGDEPRGIFAMLLDPKSAETIDKVADAMDAKPEEKPEREQS